MLNAFLNKGGAGKSIARAETAERLSRLMRSQQSIMHAYDAAIRAAGSPQLAAGLEHLNKTTRADIGKFSELILSNGEVPPPGSAYEPPDFGETDDDGVRGRKLLDRERAFVDELKAELAENHRIRASATIENALSNTRHRIETIQRMGDKLRISFR